MSTEPTKDAPHPTATGPALEGEVGERALQGIMYSERTWVVPSWIKAMTFWVSLVSLGGLAWFEADKRQTFRALLIDSVVEPEPWAGTRGDVGAASTPAPAIALPALYNDGKDGGGDVLLTSFAGKWVLVNFWATWCPPCRDEMPSMEMLNRRMGPKGLVMLAVSVDESDAEVARFFGNDKPSFAVLWDRAKKVSSTYGSEKFPETYLIAPDGTVAAKFTGPRDWYNQGTVQYFEDIIAGRRKPVRDNT